MRSIIRQPKHRKRRRRSLRIERFERRQLLAVDLGNPRYGDMEDVDDNGKVTPFDALLIVNYLTEHSRGGAPLGTSDMDVDVSGTITPGDALMVINRLMRDQSGNVEDPLEFRAIDGTNNNLRNSDWGNAGIEFIRIVDCVYADGIDLPSGPDRPSARAVSNLIGSQAEPMPNTSMLSDMAWQWGQFIDHDIDLTREGHEESFDIEVPEGDPMFDPTGTGNEKISMMRSAGSDASAGDDVPREQVNDITAYIDGSMVYGSDQERAHALRTMAGGRLKVSEGDLLPYNVDELANAGSTAPTLFLAGDVRANEQAGLTSMHTLWVREHNRIADQLASEHPEMTDEEVYQCARAIVIGEIQAITYNEYLPAILGDAAIEPYSHYDRTVNVGISNLFATAAFRFGHTQLPSELVRLDDEGQVADEGPLPLRDAFFTPAPIEDHGIDSLLKGLTTGVAQQIDTRVVDDVRNFLFGPPGAGGFDLASLNIQRGRDHGLPDYNTIRTQLGLTPVESFDQITSDQELAEALEEAYESVDKVDAWVGGLAEDKVAGANVGELMLRVIGDQFAAIRDGDRFWYQNTFSGELLEEIHSTRLSDVIERNTALTSIQDNAFYAPAEQTSEA